MQRPISIVILANCNADVLERMLLEMLVQQYEPGYEVIVVRESKKGSVTDLMEALMLQYSNLRTTFLPAQPQYVTDYEVEIMLGVKAAKNDDIIMVGFDFMPPSDTWLSTVAEAIGDGDTPLRIAMPPYPDGTSFFHRYSHRRKVNKVMRKWRKTVGLSKSDIVVPKAQRHLFAIAYNKKAYIDDPLLRNLIYVHEDA